MRGGGGGREWEGGRVGGEGEGGKVGGREGGKEEQAREGGKSRKRRMEWKYNGIKTEKRKCKKERRNRHLEENIRKGRQECNKKLDDEAERREEEGSLTSTLGEGRRLLVGLLCHAHRC